MDVPPQVELARESGIPCPVMTFGHRAAVATCDAQLAQRGEDGTDEEITFVHRPGLDLTEVRCESQIPLARRPTHSREIGAPGEALSVRDPRDRLKVAMSSRHLLTTSACHETLGPSRVHW
jgi:hypothetical protein